MTLNVLSFLENVLLPQRVRPILPYLDLQMGRQGVDH